MEFRKVCGHMARMCEMYYDHGDCTDCPIIKFNVTICDAIPMNLGEISLEKIEQIVAEWAKEHPEPVYETWYDYLYKLGSFKNCQETPRIIVAQILNKQHIPPDIGKKLGLKPVNGSDG